MPVPGFTKQQYIESLLMAVGQRTEAVQKEAERQWDANVPYEVARTRLLDYAALPIGQTAGPTPGAPPYTAPARATVSPGSAGAVDATTQAVLKALKDGSGYMDADGRVHLVDPLTKKPTGVIFDRVPGTDRYVFSGKPEALSADAAARIGFDRERLLQEADQFNRTMDEGRRQFDAKFNRDQFTSDRDYTRQREEFGKTHALEKSRFDFEKFQAGEAGRARASEAAQRQYEFDYSQIAEARRAEDAFALQRAGLAQQAESKLADLGQQQQDRAREILREAPDFLARAYFTRGEVSPQKQVTQADLLNTLSQEIQAAQAAIRGTVPAARAPQNFQLPSRPTPFQPGTYAPAPATSPVGSRPAGIPDWVPTPEGGWLPPSSTPGLAAGGTTRAQYFMVGEQGPELIQNPERADIGVLNNQQTQQVTRQVPGFALGTDPYAQYTLADRQAGRDPRYAEADARASLPQFQAFMPEYQPGGAYYDPKMNSVYSAFNPAVFSASGQVGPQAGKVNQPQTQEELKRLAIENQPPAVRDVLSGRKPKPLRFGFAMPTAQMLSTMTDDELKALGTRLATENVSLQDLMFAVRNQFTPQEVRRPRYLGSV